MRNIETTYIYNNKEYKLVITKKRMRSIRFRFIDNVFYISCPYTCFTDYAIKCLDKYAGRLIESEKKRNNKEPPITNEYVYIFGDKYSRSDLPQEDDKLEKLLKRLLLEEVTKLTRINEEKMSIRISYKVTVRKMKSRWGSNSSKTHHITYSFNLIHFSKDIIESVVVHELCHDKYKDHQKGFYNELYYYSPNYNLFRKKLNKGIYK